MKGFTLLEATYVILIISLIFTITFYGFSFRREFFYLKNFAKNLRLSLETTNDMSQRAIFKNNYLFCGYGVYFPSSTYYEVLGFYTTSTECDIVFKDEDKISNFISNGFRNKYYVTYYGDLTTSSDSKLILNGNFKGTIFVSTSTLRSGKCFGNINYPIILLSIYSISEFYLFLKKDPNWTKINSDNIYICLEYKNDLKVLRINKLGQIFIER